MAEEEKGKAEEERGDEDQKKFVWDWSIDQVRGMISLVLVGGFVFTMLICLLTASTGGGTELLQTMGSIYSGVTGAVIGYYFGKGQT